jgi:hypothetical protein
MLFAGILMAIEANGTAAAGRKISHNQKLRPGCLAVRSRRWYSPRKRKVSVYKESVMRILSAAAVVVLLTAPAYAQTPNINLIPELQSKSPEEREQEAAKDKAYKDSLRKIPDAKASSDPWGTVRSNDAPKAAAAPAKKKTGSTNQ